MIAEARLALPRRHAEALAPQMRFVCEQAGVALGDVEAVAVDHGPGLYTGLRAGLATAKATAAALGIGVVPVGSLEALAFGAAVDARPGGTVLSVLDARRGEVFWAWYRHVTDSGGEFPSAIPGHADGTTTRASTGQRDADVGAGDCASNSGGRLGRLVELSAPRVGPPADLLAGTNWPDDRTSGDIVVVGDGALRYADLLAVTRAVIAGPELRFPSPAAVATLGRERALAGGTVTPEQVDAVYLRPPDARPQPTGSRWPGPG